jgi:trk system potassium uptake protein TrkA
MSGGNDMQLIVIGCGRVGAGLAQNLNQRGHAVTVVDTDPNAFNQLGPAFRGQKIVGVGFDRKVLLGAGVERTDGLAAVTSSDETNVVTAQVARQVFRVPKVVARVNQPRQAAIYHRLGLQTIAPTTWGISRIADLLCRSQLDTVLTLGNGEVNIVHVEISPELIGKSVHELSMIGEIAVVSITRRGQAFLPTPGTLFEAGDLAHIAVMNGSTDRLNALLGLR